MDKLEKYCEDLPEKIASSPFKKLITDKIGEYMKEEYGADNSRLCRNMWDIRIDLEIGSKDELEKLIDEVNSLSNLIVSRVEDKSSINPTQGSLYWRVLVTDTKGHYDGFRRIGEEGKKKDELYKEHFPLKAFEVSVDKSY